MAEADAGSERAKQPIVLLLYAYTRRVPRSPDEYNRVVAVGTQKVAAHRFCDSLLFEIVAVHKGFSTNRKARFDRNEHYHAAVATARKQGCPLLIGDLFGAFRHLEMASANGALKSIIDLDVPIFDAVTKRHFQSMSLALLRTLMDAERKSTLGRSIAIKRGIVAATTDRAVRRNQPRSRPRTRRMVAERLRSMIEEIEKGVINNEALTPTVLSRELNARGERAYRGGHWSRSSAKRLLDEYRKLQPKQVED